MARFQRGDAKESARQQGAASRLRARWKAVNPAFQIAIVEIGPQDAKELCGLEAKIRTPIPRPEAGSRIQVRPGSFGSLGFHLPRFGLLRFICGVLLYSLKAAVASGKPDGNASRG
jgi:hypothetical protein